MLKARHIMKTYGEKRALENVDIQIEKGKVYALVGNNGAGKTTLLNILAAQTGMDGGNIEFNGHALQRNDLNHIAYCTDHSLFAGDEKIADIMRKYAYFFSDFDSDKADELLLKLHIPTHEKLNKLSFGERKKCELVMVLARNADLYLLDEPFANLDPLVRQEIIKLIVTDIREDSACIIATHQVMEIETYVDGTIFLKDGHVMLQGDNDELREREHCTIHELLIRMLKEEGSVNTL